MAVKVNSDNFQSEIIDSEPPVLVDFYSESCIPCKIMSPVLAELDEEYGGRVKLAKVNINFNAELAEEHQVLSAPTLVFFQQGVEQERTTGVQGKDNLRTIINKLLEESK